MSTKGTINCTHSEHLTHDFPGACVEEVFGDAFAAGGGVAGAPADAGTEDAGAVREGGHGGDVYHRALLAGVG